MSVCWVVKARKEQGQEGNQGVTACRSDKNPKDAGCLQEGTGAETGGQKVLAACRRDKKTGGGGCVKVGAEAGTGRHVTLAAYTPVWDEYKFFGQMNIRIYLLP